MVPNWRLEHRGRGRLWQARRVPSIFHFSLYLNAELRLEMGSLESCNEIGIEFNTTDFGNSRTYLVMGKDPARIGRTNGCR